MNIAQSASRTPLKLLITIPAYNEEDSIASIIERSLQARSKIIEGSPVTAVEITVVSDGSTDRTVENARRYEPQIRLVVFPRNRGYGAAIKEGWGHSDAELLSFLDADGTCDPLFFANLCRLIEQRQADVVLGCRMTKESKMPLLRRVGNFIFALLLTFFSSARVRDTASGMRVVRRSSLPKIFPLPDGMHFTPAMSARAILSPELRIYEEEMPYHGRAGESKLRVIRDGLRFLRVIVEAAVLYRPSRPTGFVGVLFLLTAAGLIVGPTVYYLRHHQVLEWMIYRFVVADLLTTSGILLLCASYLSRRIVQMVLQLQDDPSGFHRAMRSFLRSWAFYLAVGALLVTGAVLVAPSFVQLVRTGATYEHWSRFIAMSVCASIALTLVVTRIVDFSLDLLGDRLAYMRGQG